MNFFRLVLTATILAISLLPSGASGQGDFGQVLLQAFTTGSFLDGGGLSPSTNPRNSSSDDSFGTLPTVSMDPLPEETFEDVSEMFGNLAASPIVFEEESRATAVPVKTGIETPTKSETESNESEEGAILNVQTSVTPIPSRTPSPNPSISTNSQIAESDSHNSEMSSPTTSPEQTATITPEVQPKQISEVTSQPTIGESMIDSLANQSMSPPSSDTVFNTIKVNCGGMEERSSTNEDKEKWYNVDSQIAEDPYAAAHFINEMDSLLYSTYRYADAQISYMIPLPAPGLYRVVLQWAEISQYYMREGARVFSVSSLHLTILSSLRFYISVQSLRNDF